MGVGVPLLVGGRVAQPEVGAQVDDALAGGQGHQRRLGRGGVGQAEADDVGRVQRRVGGGQQGQGGRSGENVAQRLAGLRLGDDESDVGRGVAAQEPDKLQAGVARRAIDANFDHSHSSRKQKPPDPSAVWRFGFSVSVRRDSGNHNHQTTGLGRARATRGRLSLVNEHRENNNGWG